MKNAWRPILTSTSIAAFTTISWATPIPQYPEDAQWHRISGGEMNISVFVYLDRNRNGSYDLADSPMMGAYVEMVNAEQQQHVRSNSGGYSNFVMSLDQPQANIRQPGEYQFSVFAPPNWQITSGNATQRINIEKLSGSPGGLIAKKLLVPVGMAPNLSIRGQIKTASPESFKVQAQSPTKKTHDLTRSPQGNYELPATPGLWTIQVTHTSTENTQVRKLMVKDAPITVSTIHTSQMNSRTALAPTREPITLDFEEISRRTILKIPNGYGELDWENAIVTEQMRYGGQGYKNGTHSGTYIVYNSSGHPVALSHPEGFNFHGGYFSVAWPRAEGETLNVIAWRGKEKIAEDAITLSALGPQWFDAQYHNITRLELSTAHYWQFVGDDFLISFPDL